MVEVTESYCGAGHACISILLKHEAAEDAPLDKDAAATAMLLMEAARTEEEAQHEAAEDAPLDKDAAATAILLTEAARMDKDIGSRGNSGDASTT